MWRIPVGAVIGLVAGAVIVAVLAIVAVPIFDISQMEGAYAMGVAFTMVPAGAILGAVIGGILGGLRWRRRA
ncbi:MAG: hypothetical protein KF887_15690 [Paracoccaceae bacterium]|nr:MAG: hypothetical protein KF887_15690 [Paracoccaceae bacterium]